MSREPEPEAIPDGLAGLVVGVPAARRAAETARLIERWGGTALVGPTVQEVEVRDPGPVLAATRQVIEAPVSWSVHLTGVGTRRWFGIAAEHGLVEPLREVLSKARVVARGQKASSALRAHDLAPEWVPPGETSREIAEWMAERVAAGEVVALQRHGEPVPGLSRPLQDAGARVVELATYTWEIPDDRAPAEQLVGALVEGRVHALVITSAPQLRNLFRIAAELGLEDDLQRALADRVFVASVGTVAAEPLASRGLTPGVVARPARLGALLRALAASRAEVLAKAGAV